MSAKERLRKFKILRGGAAAYRNQQRDKSSAEYQKYIARKTVENNLKSGKLIKQPCERCGEPKSQAHHEDYSKPLEVIWLCPKDHKARHREMAAI